MENEKFQELVLEHLARLSQENNELKNELKAEINQLRNDMNQKFEAVEKCLDKTDSKLDHAVDEIARLREDVTGLQNEKFEIKRVK